LPRQAEALLSREPDIVCLQEVTHTSEPLWRDAVGIHLPHIRSSLSGAERAREPRNRRGYGVLIAARWPLRRIAQIPAPWPETTLSVAVKTPGGSIEIHGAHVPNSRNGWIKVETLEAIYARLARRAVRPRVLCGDFNTPRSESGEGRIKTFARDQYGRLREERGVRWDRAELAPLVGLAPHGMVDVFRAVHGYGRKEISWGWPRFPRSGYRLDHVIASTSLRPTRCEYLHEFRLPVRLSDHAPVEADFLQAIRITR
jgi:endonuclease/exonuclease/phosphatase family metal-dependent hydrolase